MKTLRVLLAVAAMLALGPVSAFAQAGTVRGRVVEQGSGQALPGVSVSVVGTTLSVVTNQEGRFALSNVPAGQRTVRAVRIGYSAASQTVTVGAQPVEVTLTLGADALGLDEIVVVGYGQVERRNVTGAIVSVRPEEMQDIPAPTVDNILQGRAAGVQVTQNSGVPGAAISVRVRGASSISASNQPLYVVDGVPLLQGNFSGINGSFGGQDIDALADLNPNEIESIEVLKDASAAAIYGSRASNGVVLITTRRGRALERPEIRLNAYYGSQAAWRTPGMLNAAQYVALFNEAYENEGYADYYDLDDDPDLDLHENFFGYTGDAIVNCADVDYDAPAVQVCDVQEVDPNVDTDWVDEVVSSAPLANLFGSIAGGSERTRYFVSGNYFEQDGIVAAYGYNRLNGRLNLDYSANDKLTLGTSVSLVRSVTERARGDNTIYGPFANAFATDPLSPVFDEDGEYNFSTVAGYDNAVALMRENRAEERAVHIIGNAFANYNLRRGIDARFTVGMDHYNLRSKIYDSPIIGPWTGSGGHGEATNSYANKLLTEGTLNWQAERGQNALSGVVGAAYETNDLDFNGVEGVQFPTGQFRQLTSAALIIGGNQYVTENNLQSFFGRASHTYNDRLTTTLNIRADGSSRFGENNRWGVFPSASMLYRLSEESFLQNQNVISDLSVRASYGLTGNQQGIGNYASLGLFSGGANYGDRGGLAPAQLPNPDLSWEKTAQLNIGGDIAFFSDRLGFSFDWYNKKTTDLLLDRPVPLSTGFGVLTENIGSMRNTGVELSARAQLVRADTRQGFNWDAELNVSSNRNRVLDLYGDEAITISDEVRIEEGQPLGVFYTYKMEGLFQQDDAICYTGDDETAAERNERCRAAGLAFQDEGTVPGDIRFADTDKNGVINADDRTIVGNPWPKFQGGFTNTLSYAGLDLMVFMQFTQGNDIFNGNRLYTDANGYYFDNVSTRSLNRWTPENTDTDEPRASYDDPNTNRRSSSRYIEDGSYVRVKNAVLGYNVPASFSRGLGLQTMRVYLQAQNLFTWTEYSGFDPEVNFAGNSDVTRGYDFYTLPQPRTISLGFNVGL